MKKILCCLSLVLTALVQAQDVSIKQGQEFTPEENSTFNYYIGNDDSGIYMKRTRTRGKGTSYFVQKLDGKTLKSVYTKDFDLDKDESISNIYLKKDRIILFTEKYDAKAQEKLFLMREYAASSGAQTGATKTVASLNSDQLGVGGRSFYVSFSPNDSKVAIVSEFQWPKKLQEVQVDIYEFPSYKKLSSKKLLDAYGESTINSYNYRIDNDGRLFYLFNYMIDFEEMIAGKALASIQPEEVKSTVTPLPFEKLEIQNGTFDFVNDKLVFSGVFKDIVKKKDRKEGKVKNVGVYSFFIDPKTNAITSKGYDYFPADIKEKLNYKDGLVQADPAEKFYSFEDIFTFNNNVYLIESHSYAISGNGYTSYERELLVSKFNSAGRMEWMKIIPKFTANNLNSFNHLVYNNKVYLFYCEHPKNLEKYTITDYSPKGYREIKNYNGSVLVCTSFDEAGTLSRKELFTNEGWCYDPMPQNIMLEKDNSLLFRMINRGEERFDVVKVR